MTTSFERRCFEAFGYGRLKVVKGLGVMVIVIDSECTRRRSILMIPSAGFTGHHENKSDS
jgi:hypothetical protein